MSAKNLMPKRNSVGVSDAAYSPNKQSGDAHAFVVGLQPKGRPGMEKGDQLWRLKTDFFGAKYYQSDVTGECIRDIDRHFEIQRAVGNIDEETNGDEFKDWVVLFTKGPGIEEAKRRLIERNMASEMEAYRECQKRVISYERKIESLERQLLEATSRINELEQVFQGADRKIKHSTSSASV